MQIEYRRATPEDLEAVWNMNIADHAGDSRWAAWKEEYISHNRTGRAATYVVLCDGHPVGEGTLLFSPQCSAIEGRTALADGGRIANVNALRIRSEHEGRGHISALVRMMERDAALLGYARLTIGVDARETRNLAIYLHWGYDRFVMGGPEDGELVLYYAKDFNS